MLGEHPTIIGAQERDRYLGSKSKTNKKVRANPAPLRRKGNLKRRPAAVVDDAKFDPLEHSVYLGRRLLGRCSRVGLKLYAAFDARGCWLGDYKKPKLAYLAISRRSRCTKNEWAAIRRSGEGCAK